MIKSSSVSIEMAKKILGPNYFFGPDEWIHYFGTKASNIIDMVGSDSFVIKCPQEILEKPGLLPITRHFMFLGSPTLVGNPLTIHQWMREVSFGRLIHPVLVGYGWEKTHTYDSDVCDLKWYFMPVGTHPGKVVPSGYEIPNMIERVTANILFAMLNHGTMLDAYSWALTSDEVSIRGISPNCLAMSWENFLTHDHEFALSRKLDK